MRWRRRATYIEKQFGATYLPEQPNLYASKAAAQEAHEAIRPSNVGTVPSMLVGMESDAVRLYDMIWRQFVACQMPPAQYTSTTVTAQAGDFEARIRGRILRFDGFTRVLPAAARKDEDRTLPDFVAGETLAVAAIEPHAAFHEAAAALWRGQSRARTREARHRSAVDLRGDHFDDSGTRLRHVERAPLSRGEDRRTGHRPTGGELRQPARFRIHRATRAGQLDQIADGAADWREVSRHLLWRLLRQAEPRASRRRRHATEPRRRTPTFHAVSAAARCRSAPAAPAYSSVVRAMRYRRRSVVRTR